MVSTIPFVNSIPLGLIVSRGLIGLVVLGLAAARWDASGWITAALIVVGVLTDVFDGVVARRLKISTDHLRLMDSRVDVFFFLCLIAGIVVAHPALLTAVAAAFLFLAVLELAVHAISFVRFRKESSTHHYASKLFSIFLFALVIQLSVYPEVTWYYTLVLVLGFVSYLEAALIMLTIQQWRCDIRSYFDVIKEGKQ